MPDGPDGLSDSGLAAAMAAVSMRDAVAGKLVYQDKAAAGGKLSEPVIEVTMRRALTGKLFFQDDKVPSGLTVGELADRFSRKVAMRLFIGNNIHGEESLPPDAVLANVARVAGAQDGLHLHAVFDTGHLQAIFNPGADGRPVRSDDQATLEDLNQRFLVLAKVGSGTFSNVYKALRQDTDPEKLVAIKKLEIDEEEGGIPAAQIREVSLVKQLDHPHIVKMMDIATTSNALLLVFELLDMDLRAFMRGNPDYFTGRSQLWSAVHQCSIGLHHCHVQRIIHRDLKPENLLVDLGPRPPFTVRLVLCDFGMSRSVHGFADLPKEGLAGFPPMTPQTGLERKLSDRVTSGWWRAPEMWGWADTKQMRKRDLKSLDVFAFGLVWAGLLTRKSVITHEEGVDPPKFRLLEILRKVDRPTDTELQELGFGADVANFCRQVLAGTPEDLEAAKAEMASPEWPENEAPRLAILESSYTGIREWVRERAYASEDFAPDSPCFELMEQATRFSYRRRPSVEQLIGEPYFDDIRAEAPPRQWMHREAPHFDDVREALEVEQKKQRMAAQRAQELGALRRSPTSGQRSRVQSFGEDASQAAAADAFMHRLVSNAAATIDESVRSVCDLVRAELTQSQHRRNEK
mmetsp:Transcript_101927/g.220065  ORF Transcript_101927/g.220065 Transcript_101927/m.220065 type:complete len:632 (-) Transcript_101927:95-1990(-)